MHIIVKKQMYDNIQCRPAYTVDPINVVEKFFRKKDLPQYLHLAIPTDQQSEQ